MPEAEYRLAQNQPANRGEIDENIVVAEAVDPFEESVRAELEKLRTPKTSWIQTVVVLAISLVLFIGLGMRNSPIAFTAMLVGVLLFHELGHYLGMRLFGYRNVRMFFIPFFGAAVSGQRTNAKSYQEAIVTLLGPLPGLCLSAVLFAVAMIPGIGREARLQLGWASVLFGLINAFNLLPVFPLDGGRLLNQVLFSRNRYLESVVQVLAALALVGFGVAGHGRFFWFLGIWLLLSVASTFKTSTIAQRVRGQFGGPLPAVNEPIPSAVFLVIVAQMRLLLPSVKTAKGVAGVMFRVWEKMHVRAARRRRDRRPADGLPAGRDACHPMAPDVLPPRRTEVAALHALR